MQQYRKRLVVGGRVQGVGFRYFTVRLAEDFNVTGYVRNLPGGKVEIVAEGASEDVEAFIERAAVGPSVARVTEMTSFIESPEGGYESFGVKY